MKKAPAGKRDNDLRREYDLSELKVGVRGKYYREAAGAARPRKTRRPR